jgi:predicted ATPase/DNA-binding winged helix-turn-helix (wHTH) protein
MQEQAIAFGPYLLFRSRKVLLESNRPVHLGSRAMDILIALVERAGEVVTKNELMRYAWPNTVVEENNLRVHVTAIRKSLGDGQGNARYIVNMTGRGYSFVAPVTRLDARISAEDPQGRTSNALPGSLTHVVGRDEVIAVVVAQVPGRRLVSITGPGGVGKTTVGLAAAQRLGKLYQRVCFVDLSVIEDVALVAPTLATAIGISALTKDPLASLIAYLRAGRFLLVLDNCEHVISRAAELAERLVKDTDAVAILATSREPLLAAGEYVCDLEPLRSPAPSADLTATVALEYPAIQLFVERAIGGLDSFELTDENVHAVAAICRRLDGIPLAIELVAARVNVFGVEALGKSFGDDMLLATKGRRTAGTRHQSLRATLDWSYHILAPVEQTILRRLAVFTGLFSAEAAAAVLSGDALATTPVLDALISLVSKSLLTTDVGGPGIRYRLLHTTRAYAAARLAASDERTEMLRRHAEYFRSLLEASVDDWERMTRPQWLAQYGVMIDDVRAATDWAFGPGGNLELAVALTVASLPFGFQLSLINETVKRATLALEVLERATPARPHWVIRINNMLASLLMFTGVPDEVVLARIQKTLTLARNNGVSHDLIEPLISQSVVQWQQGDFAAALQTTSTLEETAQALGDGVAKLVADRVAAQTHHFLGSHERARSLAERVLRHPALTIPLRYKAFTVDRKVSMRIILARIAWLEGRADQAERIAAEALELAASDGVASMCQALGLAACPIAFWRGDLSAAARLSQNLLEYSRRFTFDRWSTFASCYQLSARRRLDDTTDAEVRAPEIESAVPEGAFFRETLSTIWEDWIDQPTLDRARRGLCGWAGPEILRAAAERCLVHTESSVGLYEESRRLAQSQNALAWELRSTMSLARIWSKQGRQREAAEALRSVYARFDEGFETADLQRARKLLDRLRNGLTGASRPEGPLSKD